jgi:hypothetical protein
MAPLALRIIENAASAQEQAHYAQRLIAAGEALRQRANKTSGAIIEGEVLTTEPLALPGCTVEPDRER